MAKRIGQHLRGNVVAYVALFFALGGSAYAVTALDRNSVRSKHIKNGQVKIGDAKKSAFGRGTVFGGIEFISSGMVNAGYPPSGWNETVNGPSVVPSKLRLRDFRVQLDGPFTSGARVHALGSFDGADLRVGLSCEISAGEDSCTDPGPSGVLRPGDLLQLVIRGTAGSARRVAFAWRAATP